jgi:hypothetical protein
MYTLVSCPSSKGESDEMVSTEAGAKNEEPHDETKLCVVHVCLVLAARWCHLPGAGRRSCSLLERAVEGVGLQHEEAAFHSISLGGNDNNIFVGGRLFVVLAEQGEAAGPGWDRLPRPSHL